MASAESYGLFWASVSANLVTHSLQMRISVSLAKSWGVPDRVLGAEEGPHLLVGLPAEPAFELGRVRRGLGDDRRLFVVRLEVCHFVGQGVDVGVASGRLASLFHGYLRSPEGLLTPGQGVRHQEHEPYALGAQAHW
jgi:hypothetical protein